MSQDAQIVKINAQTFRNVEGLERHVFGTAKYIKGISPEELFNQVGSVQFDMNKLNDEFKKMCRSHNEPIDFKTKSEAIEFSKEIIFNLGPESRRIKRAEGDRTWIFYFHDNEDVEAVNQRTVLVNTFKVAPPPMAEPKVLKNRLSLTMKQASLLAMVNLTHAANTCMTTGRVLVTPLSGAIFNRDDVDKILKDFKYNQLAWDRLKLVLTMMHSCQSGGQYLEYGDSAFAVAAAICSTQNLDSKLGNQIVGRVFKQYNAAGKVFNEAIYRIIVKYATGGIPAEYSPDKLRAIATNVRLATMRNFAAVEAAQQIIDAETDDEN